jgi:hypothetical protein
VPAGVPVDPPPELLLELDDPLLLLLLLVLLPLELVELDDPLLLLLLVLLPLELVELPLLLETADALDPLPPPHPGNAAAPINSSTDNPV